jgi:hypothetical protein
MSELKAKQNPDSVAWQAESLRLTAFLSPSSQIGEQDWWRVLTSEVPDRRTSEPRTGLQQEEGKFKDEKIEGTLVLTIQPTRIDWQLVPLVNSLDSGFPTIGSFLDSLDSFFSLMMRWIESAPQIKRLAFGVVLNESVKSSEEGYHSISRYLPSFNLDENSSDFLYQINRPRKSVSAAIPELSINRLSRWSVSLLAGFVVDPSKAEQYIARPAHFAVRLELDINTPPDFSGAFTSEQLPQVFQELVELGKEIATKGDIK